MPWQANFLGFKREAAAFPGSIPACFHGGKATALVPSFGSLLDKVCCHECALHVAWPLLCAVCITARVQSGDGSSCHGNVSAFLRSDRADAILEEKWLSALSLSLSTHTSKILRINDIPLTWFNKSYFKKEIRQRYLWNQYLLKTSSWYKKAERKAINYWK